jgi:predicted nucleic acid-binding protein
LSRWVVDASVGVQWVVDEPHSEAAARLLGREHALLAPELFFAEAGSVLWKYQRRGEMNAEEALQALSELLSVPLETYQHAALIPRAMEIALETGRSVYDSLYVALAEDQECVLVTADRRLYNSTRGGPYAHRIAWVQDEF